MMKNVFYDTCSLLILGDQLFEQEDTNIYISSVTLRELEEIKTSDKKDADVKYAARHLLRTLDENNDRYTVVIYTESDTSEIIKKYDLPINNDSKILALAYGFKDKQKLDDMYFCTNDLCLKSIANMFFDEKHIISANEEPKDNYTGFKEVTYTSDEELAGFYDKIFSPEAKETFGLNINEYLFIKSEDGVIIDKYKCNSEGVMLKIPYYKSESRMFGKIVPKDSYQTAALDSFNTNVITMIQGRAGSGKSYLALGYLFEQLEKRKIDKIIVFCNTIAAQGAAKLGYYPGDKNDKLLDSQIGNMLSSKLGDRVEVERLIDDRKLLLLPLSDLRGFDTTGLNAGIYITEAQNMSIELMRLALQRIGEDSICIIDGDTKHQVDSILYSGANNGMRRVSEIFRGCDYYGEIELQNIYRSRIARQAELM